MLTIAVHARWTGQPNRAAGLRDVLDYATAKPGVRFMRRADIAQLLAGQPEELRTRAGFYQERKRHEGRRTHLHQRRGRGDGAAAEESLLSRSSIRRASPMRSPSGWRRRIRAGELQPGQRLRQEDLCERFGVSRTPIREALRKLQAQRLVVVIPNKGAAVRIPSRKEIEEIYDLRAELESFAAELACSNATAGDRRGARCSGGAGQASPACRRWPRSGGIAVQHRNQRRHPQLPPHHSGRRGNRPPRLHGPHAGSVLPWRLLLPRNGANRANSTRCIIDEHEGIRAAVQARDADAARALMRAHIRHAKEILLRYLDERGFWGDTGEAGGSQRRSGGAG